ncbi:MAG: SET domain-containing protein-lysine N-methyltransferase [Bacteroidetes bacterium]|nr:SET domain-containing protein-lysine N-methyltransferase [Bacteroidota bacterium]
MNSNIQTQQTYTILYHQVFADILQNNITGEKSLHTTKAFTKGEVLCNFSGGTISSTPTYLTVQIDLNKHITLQPEFLQYCNHSCNPNCFFNTSSFEFVAVKDIAIGDELTFFYPSSEWNMTQQFACTCGSKNCLQTIKGAAYLSKEILSNYKLTDFIQSMLEKQ